MNDTARTPLVESVLHPTDFSAESGAAFAHALAVALVNKAKLTILHAGADPRARAIRGSFPSVRAELERWGLLEPDSPRSAVFDQLSVKVKKVVLPARPTITAILEYLDSHPADLIVLATRGGAGLPRWIKPSVSMPLARQAEAMTLFVPKGATGIVSPENGRILVRRILIPVDRRPDPRVAVNVAARVAQDLDNGPVEFVLLHAGDDPGALDVRLPQHPACLWRSERVNGEAVDRIVQAAERGPADLILMATAGREGVLDALRGSTTEQVLRKAPCPVLAVPATWDDRRESDRPVD